MDALKHELRHLGAKEKVILFLFLFNIVASVLSRLMLTVEERGILEGFW